MQKRCGYFSPIEFYFGGGVANTNSKVIIRLRAGRGSEVFKTPSAGRRGLRKNIVGTAGLIIIYTWVGRRRPDAHFSGSTENGYFFAGATTANCSYSSTC